MNILPNELLDIIWNDYWGFIYTEQVIEELKKPKYEINKITNFLKNHFIGNKSELYDKQITHYLEKYNLIIKKLNNNKGLKLLCKINCPKLKYCFDEEYKDNCFKNVKEGLKEIAIFTILSNHYELRYEICYRYTKL